MHFIWYWLRSDKSRLFLTRYSGYILQVWWINLLSSHVTFLLDSVYQKLLQEGQHPLTNSAPPITGYWPTSVPNAG